MKHAAEKIGIEETIEAFEIELEKTNLQLTDLKMQNMILLRRLQNWRVN